MDLLIKVIGILSLFALFVSADIVNTIYGPVSGTSSTTHKIWKGIPYAAAPVGPLRFQPPQAPTPWTVAINTSDYGSRCIQGSGTNMVGSEDCLFINVWVPIAATSTSNLPVLAYIYGGSFTGGASNNFDGEFLSGSDVIYVNFNYRVGALGFLYHPALLANSSVGTSGFYGMQDQRFAFKWIRDNIAAFGGNPGKITMSAESAGAISLCLHLLTTKSNGLFDQAISQSGYCGTFTQAEGTQVGSVIATRAGCTNATNAAIAECLYNASPAALQLATSASSVFVFYPTSHPYEVPDFPMASIISGNFNAVPIMGGTNLNESSYTFCGANPNFTLSAYVARLQAAYLPSTVAGTTLDSLLSVYNASNYPTPVSALIAVGSDRSFKCNTKALFESSTSKVATYMYSFERTPSFNQGPCFGAAHAYELNFLYPLLNRVPLVGDELALSQTMRNAWVTYTATGIPSINGGAVAWPAYTATNEEFIILNTGAITSSTMFQSKFCPVWNLSNISAIGQPIPATPTPAPSTTGSTTNSPGSTTNNLPSDGTTTGSGAGIVGPSSCLVLVLLFCIYALL